jgi:hypothetical protein
VQQVSSTSGLGIGGETSTGLDAVVAQVSAGLPSLPLQQDEDIVEVRRFELLRMLLVLLLLLLQLCFKQ